MAIDKQVLYSVPVLFVRACTQVALKAWILENSPRAILRVAARKSCTVLGQVKLQDD